MIEINEKLSTNIRNVLFLCLGFILLYFVCLNIYNEFFGYHVRARFSDLEPLDSRIPVYCKGKKIGETQGVTLNKDYKFSTIKILFYPQDLKLPKNCIAKRKKVDAIANYIEIIYPEKPFGDFIKTGDTINGQTAMDFQALLSDLGESGDLKTIVSDFSRALASIESAGGDIGQFFDVMTEVMQENRSNVAQTTTNTLKITRNLNQVTTKFNNTIKEPNLKNIILNINKSSEAIKQSTDYINESSQNIKEITQKVGDATINIDETVANIDKTISEVKAASSNAKCITCAIRQSLQKRFAGMRIIFGKPLD